VNSITPAETALLVMDMQTGIIGRVADGDALLQRTAAAIEKARRARAHVAYIRVAFDDADLAAFPARNKMSGFITAAGRSVHADAAETQIHPAIAPQPGDIVVRKTRVGAFSSTNLEDQLRERGVIRLILAGVATSGIVLSMVREAADRDYELYVLSDAVADLDPEVHRVLLEKVFPRQSEIITVDGLDQVLT
jgi:nicotinamidase-related amidase